MTDILTANNNNLSFEDFGHENGTRYWWASDYASMLGYANYSSFINPINRAIKSCMNANIDYFEDFRKEQRIVNGIPVDDIKLSRFACYMIAMNADIKKPIVAKAQAYFAAQIEKINIILEGSEEIERLNIRDDIRGSSVSLNFAAKGCGVVNFALFHDAGYKGLYNRGIKDVKKMKGIKETADHFEYMGRVELSANLFRMTMTEERLKTQPVYGEKEAMDVHKKSRERG
jgi:DNA-damage-inducible protein D